MNDEQNKHGWAVWFVGLPGSGKSSVARAVHRALEERGISAVHLQMDKRRKVYIPQPSYSSRERDLAYGMFVQEAAGLTAQGRNVIMDATAPRRNMRRAARERISRFAEVYVKCSLETAMQREAARPGGLVMADLYRKALERKRTGRQFEGLGEVIGVDVPFEEDYEAECVVENDLLTVDQARDEVLSFIMDWLKAVHGGTGHDERMNRQST